MNIRSATPVDAEAIAGIYALIVRGTTISFKLEPPDAAEMRTRIEKTFQVLPWAVQ